MNYPIITPPRKRKHRRLSAFGILLLAYLALLAAVAIFILL